MRSLRPGLLAISLGLCLAGSLPCHSQAYDPKNGEPPPGAHVRFTDTEWKLVPTADAQGAHGTATLECFKDLKDELIIRLEGVDRKATYSVWVTRKEGDIVERAQLFKAWDGDRAKDGKVDILDDSRAYFRGCFNECALGLWRNVEIRRHADGKVGDVTSSVVVLRARMRGE